MRMTTFFDELRANNIVVFLENGKVKIDAEERFLTDDFLSKLKSIKTQIAEYLTKIERLNQLETHQVLKRLMDKGCFFELVGTGETAYYPAYLLTEAENAWLIQNHEAVMANLFQIWLMQNVFHESSSLLQDFKTETLERISIMEDSRESSAYLNGVLCVSRKWWFSYQGKEVAA